MNKEEMLRKLKGIHLLYSMPQLAQNMMPEHFAIVEYEKLAYEQQAIIDQLTNNWNELEEYVKERIQFWEEQEKEWIKLGFMKFGGEANNKIILQGLLDKMEEIKEKNNER